MGVRRTEDATLKRAATNSGSSRLCDAATGGVGRRNRDPQGNRKLPGHAGDTRRRAQAQPATLARAPSLCPISPEPQQEPGYPASIAQQNGRAKTAHRKKPPRAEGIQSREAPRSAWAAACWVESPYQEKCSLRVFKAPSRVPEAKIKESNVLGRAHYVTPKVDRSTAEKLQSGYERTHKTTASPGLSKPLDPNI